MNTKSSTVSTPHSGPHSGHFDRLMEVYEQNYILMRRLFGDLRHLRRGDECPWSAQVTSKIMAKSKFTLDVQFIDQRVIGANNRPLRLNVRVYHDVRTAEWHDPTHRDRCLQNQAATCSERQFKRNQILQHWLIQQLAALSDAARTSIPE